MKEDAPLENEQLLMIGKKKKNRGKRRNKALFLQFRRDRRYRHQKSASTGTSIVGAQTQARGGLIIDNPAAPVGGIGGEAPTSRVQNSEPRVDIVPPSGIEQRTGQMEGHSAQNSGLVAHSTGLARDEPRSKPTERAPIIGGRIWIQQG